MQVRLENQTKAHKITDTAGRKRHVKCDEGRPFCGRCTRSGHVCEGYVDPDIDSRKKNRSQFIVIQYTPQAYATPQALAHMDSREKRCLEFFLQRTVPEIEGSFTPKLWYEFLQLATNGQSPIRHAVLAVASMHEHYIMNGCTPSSQLNYSMVQYNKAIREVSQLDATRQEHAFDLALAACVLFACVEGLRGHYQSLIGHLRSGVNIMAQIGAETYKTRLSYLSHEMLQQLFMRVNAQVMATGDECLLSQNCTSHLTAIPDVFTTANEAMFALEQLYCEIMHFYLSLGQALANPEMSNQQTDGLRMQHQAYKNHYYQWTRSSTDILHSGPLCPPHSFYQLPLEALILTITSISVSISLDIDTSNGEMEYDRFEERFRDMVIVCDIFLYRASTGTGHRLIFDNNSPWRDWSAHESQPSKFPVRGDNASELAVRGGVVPKAKAELIPIFSMRFGVVPHLYWVAARCRDPHLRHRALRLLLTCNRREGIWDSTACGRIAERVISAEEKAALIYKKESCLDEKCVLNSSSDVPGHVRITVLWSKFEAGNKIKICYSNMQAHSEIVEILEL